MYYIQYVNDSIILLFHSSILRTIQSMYYILLCMYVNDIRHAMYYILYVNDSIILLFHASMPARNNTTYPCVFGSRKVARHTYVCAYLCSSGQIDVSKSSTLCWDLSSTVCGVKGLFLTYDDQQPTFMLVLLTTLARHPKSNNLSYGW